MSIHTVPPISDLSWSTNGYDLGDQASITSTNYSSLFTGGATTLVPSTPSHIQTPQSTFNKYSANKTVQAIQAVVRDVNGVIVQSNRGPIDVGSGHNLDFDGDTLQGQISPALNPFVIRAPKDSYDTVSYTGSDIRLIIEMLNPSPQADTQSKYSKQLIECTTISISVHRAKAPVRALAYINPKGFVRGTRTIAGTMVLTQFTVEVLMRFLQPGVFQTDLSKDSTYVKVDQLPPFNITMVFTNEQGYASQRRLLGVQFVDDGVVYSIQDMLSEQTISFMCEDFTPLLPLNVNSLFYPGKLDNPATFPQPTPKDKLYKYQNITDNLSNMISS